MTNSKDFINKSRTLYTLDTVNRSVAHFLTGNFNEDTVETYYMRRSDWEDFGRPLQITVTVEPGDKLNA